MLEIIVVVALVVVASSLSYLRGQYVGRIEGIAHTQTLSEIGLELYKSMSEVQEEIGDDDVTEAEFMKLVDEKMAVKMVKLLEKNYSD
jgi:hypothetical protein